MQVFFIWLLIGVLIVMGLLFNANRPSKLPGPDGAINNLIRWIALAILIIGFCALIGLMYA